MMKTVFFSAVVLSLLAVGWSAPMVCEKLSKPVEKEVDLNGTWYVIAMSTESCWQALLLNLFLWPSASMDITSKGTVNTYNANLKMKMYGYCMNETELFSNKASLDGTDPNEVYLHTGCPDCVVIKESGSIMFMSRRTIVTAAEMTEFEKQAECLGWPKVQVLNTDHGTENCKDYTQAQELSEKEMEEIAESFGKRLCDMFLDLLKCFFKILGLTCIA